MFRPVFLAALGVVSALGTGKQNVLDNLIHGRRPGMVSRRDILVSGAPIYVGQVDDDLRKTPVALSLYASRNADLVITAVEEIRPEIEAAIARFGPSRVAVVMGSSTSGVAEGERAIRHLHTKGHLNSGFDYRQQELGSVSESLALYLGLEGPAFTVSTACTSSAFALAAGRRLLRSGLADAVLVGGADSLCELTVNGFHALAALSAGICNPFSRNRDGTTIGEGAAIFLMQREEAEIAIFGIGASNDAHSMTAPEPSGRGIDQAVRQALADASLEANAIDYVHLHGTGTQLNDAAESKAIERIFRQAVPCSSSKAQIGHTLGAAGAMGAAHCWLTLSALNNGHLMPPHLWDGEPEEGLLAQNLVEVGRRYGRTLKTLAMANAFAFGGSNVSLILGKV
ncbi:MAG: beta-ketoacyl-ACP synthase [Rhodospirillaceae bacterium]|nr:beta-ketoacyl-ACP synthase [Rhodospirillaceae bacterium]